MAKKKKVTAGKQQAGFGPGFPTYKGFTPYKPPPLPSGSYDPSLDAQLGAAQRGYGDLQQDIATADLRAGQDYTTNKGLIERNRDRGFADIDLGVARAGEDYGVQRGYVERDRDRGFFDLDTALGRGREDYDREIAMLQRGFQQLGRRQAEGSRQRGVLSGGLALLAAQKRAENEALERQPIDTGFERFSTDNRLSRTRLGEDATSQLGDLERGYNRQIADFGTARTRLGEDAGSELAQLLTDYSRGGIDRGTTLSRGGRENVQFGLDIGTQKAFQAGQSGYVPPAPGQPGGMPKNEGVNRRGVPYQERTEGNWIVRYDQYGRVLSRRPRPGSNATTGGFRGP